MVKVGMQKQAQYDQGVQKIQSYIDNIAGLDVANDADKAYLQSKLNDLGGKLRSVAAGDFSNQQLVNSVSGMTSQIIKDPNIQNAVSSTAWLKKQQAELDKQYKEGKSSINNVNDFKDQVNEYLSNKKPGQLFRGTYSPYIDINKKWTEMLKGLGVTGNSTDYAYENMLDGNGKVDSNKIAAAMTRITKEGVSAARIENAIRATFTADDANQMMIDAKAKFRGVTPEQLKQRSIGEYDAGIKSIDSMLGKLQGYANQNKSNPIEYNKALESIEELTENKVKLKKNLDANLALVDSDPNAAKFNIYKEGAFNQFATAFSWEKSATQLMSNPVLAAKHQEDQLAISRANLALDREQFSWKKEVDKFDMADKEKKFNLDVEKTFGKDGGFTAYLGVGTDNLPSPVAAINGKISDLKATQVNGINQLATKLKMSPDAVKIALAEFPTNQNAIPVEGRGLAYAILNAQRDERVEGVRLNNAKAEALASPAMRAKSDAIAKDLASKNGINLITPSGERLNFTSSEVFDFLNKKQIKGGVPVGGVAQKSMIYIPENLLTAKEKALYNYMGASMFGDPKFAGQSTKAEGSRRNVLNIFGQYTDALNKHSTFQNEINTATSQVLMNRTGQYTPAMSIINTPTPESRQFYEGVANAALKVYNSPLGGTKGGHARLSQDDILEAQTWLTSEGDKADVKYSKLKYAGEDYLLLSKGQKDIMIPLPKEMARQLPTSKKESNVFAESISEMQRANGNGNTNPTGQVRDSYFQKNSFPSVKNLQIAADLQADMTDPGKNYINFAITPPGGRPLVLQLDSYPMSSVDASSFMQTATDDKIKQLYLSDPRVPQAWKDLIKKL
jgi:hypothetical protein